MTMHKYRILTNNGLHIDDVESNLTLDQLRADLNAGMWLMVKNVVINPTVIDTIVEVTDVE